jgi:hypothetical protein
MTRAERRAEHRLRAPAEHGIVSARLRPGHDVGVVDASAGGMLVETDRRLLPGAAIDLQLATTTETVNVRGRVLRCSVSRLRPSTIWYRGAIGFERHLPWLVKDGGASDGHALGADPRQHVAGRAAGSPLLVG